MNHDLFTPPADPPPTDASWTQLHLSRHDRTYRYRIHVDRLRPEHLEGEAPGSHVFELEFLGRDGTWREVRLYARRDEIWAYVVETGAVGR